VFDASERRRTIAVGNARKFALRATILLALTGTLLLVLATPVIAAG
jgi:hypothetical protein